jgi:hypothetical protein
LRRAIHVGGFTVSDADHLGPATSLQGPLVTRLATCITVLTAAIAVLIVAAAAVAFTIT